MPRLRYAVPCLLLAACKFGDDRPLGDVDASVDGMPQQTQHLLLTEVMPDGQGDIEFIEIWNPSNTAVNLGDYFLTDHVNYWEYPSGRLGVVNADFLVGFPSDATIESNQVVVVAFRAASFQTRYSPKIPDYGINLTANAGTTRYFPTRFAVSDIDMNNRPSVTDTGEYVVLFFWDRASDLVKDVDIVLAGMMTSTGNALVAKGMVDGPDSDTTQSRYKTDTGTFGSGMSAVANGFNSYKRVMRETGSERQNGDGNGITGDDETTEPLKVTWDGANSAPTPGVLPASLSQ